MASPVAAAKKVLRNAVKQRLAAVPAEAVVSQSRKIYNALQEFKPYQDANRISIYLAMPTGEVQTDGIVRHALNAGKQVFVPYLYKSPLNVPDTPARIMDMVLLKSIQDYEALDRDSWGIPSIDAATVSQRECILGDSLEADGTTLDLMLVPGVAFDFDTDGMVRRLGHGKGFYDFFLNRYFARPQARTRAFKVIGLALQEQWLKAVEGEEVPMGQYDRALHGLILGDGNVKLSKDV